MNAHLSHLISLIGKIQNENLKGLEGFTSTTKRLIENHYNSALSLIIINPEVVLFENYENYQYWSARRSMRFASNLIEIDNRFRKHHLNSTDEKDQTQLESD